MLTIPQQPFGFVAGRWVLSMADTPVDADRAPDYKPLDSGTVIFKNKLSHRVVSDGQGGSIGIVKTRYEGKINENGQLVDAEGNEFVALPVGVYTVSFSFGQYSWPQFDFELTAEHTLEAPFWLPSESPIPSGPGVVHVVSEEARLAAEAAAASAWEAVNTPGRQGEKGDRGPVGHLGFMSDTPRIVNLALGREYETSAYSNAYIQPPISLTKGDIIYTHRVYSNDEGPSHSVTGSIVILAGATIHTNLVDAWRPHSSASYHRSKSKRVKITSPVPENAYLAVYGENPAAPGLFSDINIINLTQVYGAGNEPSLEYMDALVEKHGGYIDGEQYVVGDALQALTVAGPGMSLRVDTSVGTRVLLDHPGGTTMLYGDTGWRNVQSLLEPGWVLDATVGYFRVRRTIHIAEMIGRLQVAPDAAFIGNSRSAAQMVINLPYGFGVLATYVPMGNVDAGNSNMRFSGDGPYRIRVSGGTGTWAAGDVLAFTMSASPQLAWPTALPGTPL